MSGPAHHFLPNMASVQQNSMRTQFGAGPIPNQISAGMQNQMTTQIPGQMPVQIPNQLGPQMTNPIMNQMSNALNNQMNPAMAASNQMLGQLNQQYNLNAPNQLPQHQPPNTLQMQQQSLMQNNANGLQHHAMQQNQQVLPQTTGVAPTPPVQTQAPQSKEFNTVALYRIGQETVQDIVNRTQEVFQTLKAIQPPNGTPSSSNISNEKKAKVQELLRTIRVLFKRLRLIYEKCNENCQIQGMEYTHIESLIPFKDDFDPKHDEKKNSEAYRLACEENKEVMEQVVLKNKQLKEVIDHLRRIIWEINTMLTMRRS